MMKINYLGFLKMATSFGATALRHDCANAANEQHGKNDRDGFGGWRGRRFRATGFFRTEHDGKRWWLVTPEGNAFLSLGINHYHAQWWAQGYNRDHWMKEFGAEWLREFADQAFARPNFVGWHICGAIDTWKTMPGKDAKQHSGLMTPTGEFYPEMERAIRDLSRRLYRIALGENGT